MKTLRRTIRKILLEGWLEKSSPSETAELIDQLSSGDYETIEQAVSRGEEMRYLHVRNTKVISHSGVKIWNLELNDELFNAIKNPRRESDGMFIVGYYELTIKAYPPGASRRSL